MSTFRSFRGGTSIERDIQSIEQITSKNTRGDRSLQVPIGGRNYPNVSSNCLISADTLKFVLLQYSQQRDLRFRWEFADLIQEDGAAFRQFKLAQAPL